MKSPEHCSNPCKAEAVWVGGNFVGLDGVLCGGRFCGGRFGGLGRV